MPDEYITMDLILVLDRAQRIDGGQRQPSGIAIVQHDAEIGSLVRLEVEIAFEQRSDLLGRLGRIDISRRFGRIADRPFEQAIVVDSAVFGLSFPLCAIIADRDFGIERVGKLIAQIREEKSRVSEVH